VSCPGCSLPQERPGTHCTGGRVGPRAGLDRCGKISPPPGFDPRIVQPVASHYTDYAARPTATVFTVIIYLVSKFLDFLMCSNHFVCGCLCWRVISIHVLQPFCCDKEGQKFQSYGRKRLLRVSKNTLC
jgi:hypothetical protein